MSRFPMLGRTWLIVAAGLAGCGPALPRPMTAADVARLDSGQALVAFLAQRDASPIVCDPRSTGPHITRYDQETAEAVVRALTDGKVDVPIWRRCADAVLDGGSRGDVAHLIDAVGAGTRALVTDGDIEKAPPLQARLGALQAVYIERPAGRDGDPKTIGAVFDDLRSRYFAGRFGPVARRFAGEILAVVDLEQGRYGGQPADLRSIDDIAARGDEVLLRRFADRLPSTNLREEARRRLIRLAISASPFAEVKDHAAEVEERVLREGVNRVSLAQHPAARASFDKAKMPARTVLVRQDLPHQSATLFADADGGGLSVLPALSLAGLLWVDVADLSRPITVCGPPRRFDPTPCLGAGDLTIANALAAVEPDGTVHFRDRVSEVEIVEASRAKTSFPLSISVGRRALVSFAWPLRFERPRDLVLSGPSDRGPDLKVVASRGDPLALSFTVWAGSSVYYAVVENADLEAFHIVSRGADGRSGMSGSDGLDGSTGMSGSSASCPMFGGGDGSRGGDGSNGGNGASGGDGGAGGDIQVDFACGGSACAAGDVELVRRVVISRGGAGGRGGPGGRGGRGGRGGSGGSGTTCTDPSTGASSSLSGGSDGMSGSDGLSGWNGPDGADGRPGQVRIQVVP